MSENPYTFSPSSRYLGSSRKSTFKRNQINLSTIETDSFSKGLSSVSPRLQLHKTVDNHKVSNAYDDPFNRDKDQNDVSRALKNIILSPKYFPTEPSFNSTFVSFSSIIQKEKGALTSKSRLDLTDKESSLESISRKLAFNKKQENEFRKTEREEFLKSYNTLVQKIDHETNRLKKMNKVKVLPSKRLQNIQIPVLNEDDDDNSPHDENPKIAFQIMNLNNKLDKNRQVVAFWHPKVDEDCWRPEAREGASFCTFGDFGLMFGGMSSNARDEVMMLDASKYIERNNN